MKTTGIVRKVDELGRVVLPVELRRTLNIEEKDPLEISLDGDKVILRKYHAACIFCGNEKDLKEFHDKRICRKCCKALTGE